MQNKNNTKAYSIKEVSDYLGVTTHTIRHYEKSGLYESERHETNNYRSFSREDLIYLDYIIRMRDMGISLNELVKVGREYEVNESMAVMNARDREIDKEIEELWRQKKRIRDYQESYRSILECDGCFKVETSPLLICQDVDKSMISVMEDFNLLSTMSAPKLTFEFLLTEKNKDLNFQYNDDSWRLNSMQSVTMEDDEGFTDKIIASKETPFYIRKPRKCIHKVVKLMTGKDYSAFGELYKFAKENGYTLTGNPIMRTLYISYYNYAYYDLWAPID